MDSFRIMVTGASGMIGGKVIEYLLTQGYEVLGIDCVSQKVSKKGYVHKQIDLGEKKQLQKTLENERITHIIHLAALAHTEGVSDLSWDRYFYVNVTCAKNVFSIAEEKKIPILFSSTADVYGITDAVADANTERHPIGNYAKSKCMAEDALREICEDSPYTIMRFAPVYTPEIKRDIQKRYYLKSPVIAYKVGRGTEYEVLSIENLTKTIGNWVADASKQQIKNIKDPQYLKTVDCIAEEKRAGRARIVLWVPRWLMNFGFRIMRKIMPDNMNTYMLNKVVNPLRTR